ncbi:PsbP-related protein [Flavobacterium sedimenticola]|uniref:PsbP-related protein n=1 Tax=Flavobacterium sedimenticola TaxID=3043286 RepID=A0ABT6XMT4_9FLAO|nr:PsbP-related protein [Flavobacterium sedimenticola]MDI9256385.1 PsbP-related protein [Flavobacterium sedimenticola]
MKKIVLLLILACFSCDSNQEFRTVTIANKYTIDLPDSMEKTENLNGDASLQYQNLMGELYTIVIDETKESFHNAIAINAIDIEPSLDGYSNVVRSNFTDKIKGLTISEEAETKIHGKKAKLFSITGNVEGYDVFYRYAIVEGKSNYYQIMVWTEKSRKENHKETINRIINSFKEIDKHEKLYKS